MTHADELRFLHGTCARYRGAGAVVELGSFLGRTTAAMAAGLAKSRHAGAKVVSIDTHVWDPWALEHYREIAFSGLSRQQRASLPPEVAAPKAGSSFRPLFDIYTAPVRSRVVAESAELEGYTWSGEPVEILFVDAAKSWPILDRIVGQFFPCLVDGATVIHQDYKHFFTWWLHPVTERMIADGLLQPAEDVFGTPSQAFRFRRPPQFDVARYMQAAFVPAEIEALLASSQRRYDARQGMTIAGARVRQLLDSGRAAEARQLFASTIAAGGFVDDYGLWDFLGLLPDASIDLREVLAAAARQAGARPKADGARAITLVAGKATRPVRIEWSLASHGGAQFSVQAGTPAGAGPAQLTLEVLDADSGSATFAHDYLLAPGASVAIAAPATPSKGKLRLTLQAATRTSAGRVRLLAPLLLV